MKTNRRKFFRTFGLGAASLTVGSTIIPVNASPQENHEKGDEQVLFIGDNIAVTNTTYGKVKGFILRGIHTFLGIPYGADTSGKNRFMPPQKPQAWEGIFPAVWWGNTAPQNMEKRYANSYASFVDHWNYDDVSEDCLRINIWTPNINDGKKRPVMVWLHGGGFTNGNGIEQDGYSGENLSRKGDIVFCSINHRLGSIGFSDFSEAGEKFASSGNVGTLDMVAALEWIRDNIANFGGDPNNVTISGQSGGGAKVCTLVGMPSVKGLVHKAVALSGSSLSGLNKEYSKKLGNYILAEAGLESSQMEKLQEMPWKQYLETANKALDKLRKEIASTPNVRVGFAPVADGFNIPEDGFFTKSDGAGSDIPMIICTTFHEFSPSRVDSSLENIGFDGIEEKLKPRFGADTKKIIDAYKTTFPDKKPVEIWAYISANRQAAVKAANAKSSQKAPVYLAWFGWKPPLFDNRMRAFHCLDICFWFYNTDLMLTHTGGGARPRKLAEKMSDALLKFMKTGNPNGGSLPKWTAYSFDKGETMILDDNSVLKNDPDRDARKALPV